MKDERFSKPTQLPNLQNNSLQNPFEAESSNRTTIIFNQNFQSLKNKIQQKILAENSALKKRKFKKNLESFPSPRVLTTTSLFPKKLLETKSLKRTSMFDPLSKAFSARTSFSQNKVKQISKRATFEKTGQFKTNTNSQKSLSSFKTVGVSADKSGNLSKMHPMLVFQTRPFKIRAEIAEILKRPHPNPNNARVLSVKNQQVKSNSQSRFHNLITSNKNKLSLKTVQSNLPTTDLKFIKEKLIILEQKIDLLKPSNLQDKILETSKTHKFQSQQRLNQTKQTSAKQSIDKKKNEANIKTNNFIKKQQPEIVKIKDKKNTPYDLFDRNLRNSLEIIEKIELNLDKFSPNLKAGNLLESPKFMSIKSDIDKLFDSCQESLVRKLQAAISYCKSAICQKNGINQNTEVLIAKLRQKHKNQILNLQKTRQTLKTSWNDLISELEIPQNPGFPNFVSISANSDSFFSSKINEFKSVEETQSIANAVSQDKLVLVNKPQIFSPKTEIDSNKGQIQKEFFGVKTPIESTGPVHVLSPPVRIMLISDPGVFSLKMQKASKFFGKNLKSNNSGLSEFSNNNSFLNDRIKTNQSFEKNANDSFLEEKKPEKLVFLFRVSDTIIVTPPNIISKKKNSEKHQKLKCQKNIDWQEICDKMINDLLIGILNEPNLQIKASNLKLNSFKNFNFSEMLKFCENALRFFFKNFELEILISLNKEFGISLADKMHNLKNNLDWDNSIITEYSVFPVLTNNMVNHFFFKTKPICQNLEMIKYEKTQNRMLIGALNEILCSWRPLAFKGKTLSWRTRAGNLFQHKICKNELKTIAKISLNKIKEWIGDVCGDKNVGVIATGVDMNDGSVSQNRLIKNEEAICKMVNSEMIERNDSWCLIEDEILMNLLSVENQVWHFLISDAMEFCKLFERENY